MKKWEYFMAFVSINSNGEWSMRLGSDTLKWEGIHNYFNSIGEQGWELITVTSHIGDTNPQQNTAKTQKFMDAMIAGPRVTTMTQHITGTNGYLFSFKREKSD